MATRSSSTGTAYVEAARALIPRIAAAADQIEQERRLPASIVSALVDAGLFRMLVPASLGGGEVDLITFARAIEEIARADGSTAWCLGQGAGSGFIAACMDQEAAHLIFGDPRTIVAWGPGTGTAVAGTNGYRLTGRWPFASGCHHATWMGGTARILNEDGSPRLRNDGAPEVKRLMFPASEAEFIDLWHVSGLRGTGSDSYAVRDLFVPRARALPAALSGIPLQSLRYEPGPLYDFPLMLVYGIAFASVALGIGRAALDAFVELAATKSAFGGAPLREDSVVQSQVAHAEAALRSARAFLHEAVRDAWDMTGGGSLPAESRALIRLATTSATHAAASVVDTAYHAAGATAIFASNPFERRFRDVHAVTQQVQAGQAQFNSAGRFFLGLDPEAKNL